MVPDKKAVGELKKLKANIDMMITVEKFQMNGFLSFTFHLLLPSSSPPPLHCIQNSARRRGAKKKNF